jgi:phage gp29-like protein
MVKGRMMIEKKGQDKTEGLMKEARVGEQEEKLQKTLRNVMSLRTTSLQGAESFLNTLYIYLTNKKFPSFLEAKISIPYS